MSIDIRKDNLIVYTDGSSRPSPRRGGVAIRIVSIDEFGNEVVEDIELPGYKSSTNNEMELLAPILALEELSKVAFNNLISNINKIIIKTDSMYIKENFKKAKYIWPNTKWLNSNGAPILNALLWKRLVKAADATGKTVDFQWVKGHAKDKHNNIVDKKAKASADRAINKSLSVKSVRRKSINAEVMRGSVGVDGQDVLIRVRECEWLKVQKLWKLKYEVIDTDSKYFGLVDIIFSEYLIKDGHCYAVTFNSEKKNPRISTVLCEV